MCKRWQSTIYGGTERVLYSTQVHIHSMCIGMCGTHTRRKEKAREQDKGGRMYTRYERTGV